MKFRRRCHLSGRLKILSSNAHLPGIPMCLPWYPDISTSCYVEPFWLQQFPLLVSILCLYPFLANVQTEWRTRAWTLTLAMSGSKISISVRKEKRFPNKHRAKGQRPWQGQLGTWLVHAECQNPAAWSCPTSLSCLAGGSCHLHRGASHSQGGRRWHREVLSARCLLLICQFILWQVSAELCCRLTYNFGAMEA